MRAAGVVRSHAIRTGAGLVLLAVLTGCVQTEPGSPVAEPAAPPASSAPPPAPSQSEPTAEPGELDPETAAIDPCALLTESELAQLGAPPEGKLMEDTDARFCGWEAPELRLGVALGSGTLDDVETGLDIGVGEPATVAGHEGRRISQPGVCGFITELEPDVVLGVIVGLRDPAGDSCGLVEQASGFVLPRVS